MGAKPERQYLGHSELMARFRDFTAVINYRTGPVFPEAKTDFTTETGHINGVTSEDLANAYGMGLVNEGDSILLLTPSIVEGKVVYLTPQSKEEFSQGHWFKRGVKNAEPFWVDKDDILTWAKIDKSGKYLLPSQEDIATQRKQLAARAQEA